MNREENNKTRGKNILLSFCNKRSSDFSFEANVCARCASLGYYFDKSSRVAFDNPKEIVRAIKDGAAHFDNILILYPHEMDGAVKKFVSELLGAQFDAIGVLDSGNITVFTMFSDCANRITFDDVKAALDKKYSVCFDRAVIKTVGAPHPLAEEAIKCANSVLRADGGNEAFINVSESFGDCRIEIVYTDTTPKMTVDGAIRELLLKLNPYVYAMEDISLAEQVFRLLKLRRMRISVAESFTGGGVGKSLVEVPGVSEVFIEGLNTYSNLSKSQRLGVGEETLRRYGAVSAETAVEMAAGLLSTGNCDIAVSTTGIAGPKSDNTQKPVGLAYIGVGTAEGGVQAHRFDFSGDRETITRTAINEALFLVYKELK